MPLDFARATQLFMGTEEELALALRIPIADLRAFRVQLRSIPPELVQRLGSVLVERGRGMMRVGEMLAEMTDRPKG